MRISILVVCALFCALLGCSSSQPPTAVQPPQSTVPGISDFEFVVGSGVTRSLIVRDAQHEYTFVEK
jgi:hypothetical protein